MWKIGELIAKIIEYAFTIAYWAIVVFLVYILAASLLKGEYDFVYIALVMLALSALRGAVLRYVINFAIFQIHFLFRPFMPYDTDEEDETPRTLDDTARNG